MKSKRLIDQQWKEFAKNYSKENNLNELETSQLIQEIAKEVNSIHNMDNLNDIYTRLIKTEKLHEEQGDGLDKYRKARIAFFRWCIE